MKRSPSHPRAAPSQAPSQAPAPVKNEAQPRDVATYERAEMLREWVASWPKKLKAPARASILEIIRQGVLLDDPGGRVTISLGRLGDATGLGFDAVRDAVIDLETNHVVTRFPSTCGRADSFAVSTAETQPRSGRTLASIKRLRRIR